MAAGDLDAAAKEFLSTPEAPADKPDAGSGDLDEQAKAFLSSQDDQTAQHAQLTAWRAHNQDVPPEKAAEIARYSAAARLPPESVQDNLDTLKKQVDIKSTAAVLEKSPALRAFMSELNKGQLAKDDVANLGPLEWLVTGKWEHGEMTVGPAWARAFKDARKEQEYIQLAGKEAAGLASDEEKRQADALESEGAEKDYGANNPVSKGVVGLAKMLPYLGGSVVARAAGGFAGAAAAGVAGAPSGPGEALAVPAGAAIGQQLGGASWDFYQNFGPQYRQLKALKNDDGTAMLSDGEARTWAATSSAVSGAVSSFFMGKVMGKIPGFDKLMGHAAGDAVTKALEQQPVRQLVKSASMKYGAGLVEGGLAMAAQASANSMAEEMAKGTNGADYSLTAPVAAGARAFAKGVQDMSVLAAFGPGHELLAERGRVAGLEKESRNIQSMVEQAKESKLAQRSPEHFEQLVDKMQGQDRQSIYVPVEDWNTYWQVKRIDPGVAASRVIGDGGKSYAESAATKGDVAIPLEKYLSTVGRSEHAEGLADIIRLSPEGNSTKQTLAQAEEMGVPGPAEKEATAAKVADLAAKPEVEQDVEQVRKHYFEQAKNAGVPGKAADASARLVAAAYRNFGKHMGVDAWEAYTRTADVAIHKGNRLTGRKQSAPDDSFAFGDNVEPQGVQDARAMVERMAPENKAAAQAFLDYATGKTDKRPVITPDMERKLAKFGVVDPDGYHFGEDGRSLERGLGGKKVFGEMPEELKRYRQWNIDHKMGDFSQGARPGPAASRHLARLTAGATPEQMAEHIYRDHATGLLNETAFNETPAPEGKRLAVFETGNLKNLNDHPEFGGHEVADGALRATGREVHAAHGGDVYKVKGGTRAYVDEGQAEHIGKAVNAKVDKDFPVLHGTGKSADEAFAALDKSKEEGRAAGTFPERDKASPEFEKRLPTLDLKGEKAAPSIPPHLVEAVKGLSAKEAFEKAFVEPHTGLLTAKGWNLIPRKKYVVAIDLRGLKDINARFGNEYGDRFLRHFGEMAAKNGGSDFDFAHRSGDEYLAQSDSHEELVQHIDDLRALLEESKLAATSKKTGNKSDIVIHFRHGIGEGNEAEVRADRELNRQRVEEKAGKTNNDAGAASRRSGEDRGRVGVGRRGEREALPQAYPSEEVDRLSQQDRESGSPSFRLYAGKDRGYITFQPNDGSGEPRRFDIHLLKHADESTLAHETMHFLSEVMGDIASKSSAPEELKADYQALLSHMGYDSHEARVAGAAERRQLGAIDKRTPDQQKRYAELHGKEEKVTYAWEQYLAEGKAPSAELAGVFARFKGWLTKIYRSVSSIAGDFKSAYGQDLELSDKVRGVFDRLLASEDEVAKAEAAQAAQPVPEAMASMTPEERVEYRKASDAAKQHAEGELLRRISESQHKENTGFMAEERSRIRAEVEAEYDKNPTYRALAFLKDGSVVDGPDTPMKLDRAALVKAYGKEFVGTLPKGILAPKGEGVGADEVAARLGGFEDGDAMVRAIQAAQPREAEAAWDTQARMEALYGPTLLDNPQELANKAMDAVHNEAGARKVALELRAMRRQLDPNASALSPVLDAETAKSTAERLMREKSVGELTAGEQGLAGGYLRAERTAAKRALEAAAKGNLHKAMAEKEAQLLNMSLYKAAKEAREKMEGAQAKIEADGREAKRSYLGKADPVFRDAHDAILQAIGITEPRPGQAKPSLEGLLTKLQQDGTDVAFDADAIKQLLEQPKEFGKLNMDEAQNVLDAVKSIRHIARETTEVNLAGRKLDRDTLFADMEERVSKRPPQAAKARDAALESKLTSARQLLHIIDAQLLTPDSIIQMMDAGQADGPFRQALLNPLNEARATKAKLVKEFLGKIVEAWKELPKELRTGKSELLDLTKDLPLPPDLRKNIGEGPVTRAYLWMVALNMGNAGNKQRLLDGYGWREEQVQAALKKHMTKPEWDFVQKVWDTLEGMYPHIADVHERVTGLRPDKVTPTPVETPFGTYPGGYFPAREEPRAPSGRVHTNPEQISELFNESYRRPVVASGHTKQRVEKANYYVNLSWSVVPAHISQVLHDIAYREPIRQTAALVLDPRFRDMANTYLGEERSKQVVPWLQAVANQQADSVPANVSGINRAIGWVRNRAMRTMLGGNLASMAKHILDPGLGVAGGVTSAGDTAMATAKAMTGVGFKAMREFALANSAELQLRSDHVTRELERNMRDIGRARPGMAGQALEGIAHGAQEFFGLFHEAMDKAVTTVTWTAAYTEASRKALKDGGAPDSVAHEQAVKAADEAVRKVYPSADIAQQASGIRRKDFLGASLMFASFMNKMWNLRRQSFDQTWLDVHDQEKGFAQKASAVAKFGARMTAFAAMGAGAMYLGGKRKEDDETKGQYLTRTVVADPFNDTPVLGQFAESMSELAVTGKAKVPSFRHQPVVELALEVYEKAVKASNSGDLSEEEKLQRYIETILSLSMAGSGATQIHRTLDYARQLHSGDANPRGPLDVAGGLIYGRTDKKPGNPLTDAQDVVSGQ